jgi:hypothetical protein
MTDTDAPSKVGPGQEDEDWLFSQNLALYTGEWVAVLDRRFLAHGRNLRTVYAEATAKAGPARPLFYPVPTGISGGA